MSKNNKKKVFVGMSGGVDSALSAALLKEEGYDVTGVFIKVWFSSSEVEGHSNFIPCDWKEERRDAMRVAAHLDIPFKTYDFEKEYKREVVDYMINEYKNGRTPNPDVMCNRHIKFGAFLERALSDGADCVATGHYARVSPVSEGREIPNSKFQIPIPNNSNLPKARPWVNRRLLKGVDPNKDQSYFLWTLNQKQLEKIIFPIGHLQKSQVREEARKRGLPVADKKDSQGLCFVGKIDMKNFLKEYIEESKGNVLNKGGEVIGYHNGAFFYTIGERRGFTITKKTPQDRPHYVVGKDIERNTLTVSDTIMKENLKSANDTVLIENVNWIVSAPDEDKEIEARLRYRQDLRKCRVKEKKDGWQAVFDGVEESVTPGQSIVFYDEEECLGGGVIR